MPGSGCLGQPDYGPPGPLGLNVMLKYGSKAALANAPEAH
jgi:hypothetical protein